MKGSQKSKDFALAVSEYAPYILPIALKLCQNFCYNNTVYNGLLVPTAIMGAEILAHRNRESLDPYVNIFAFITPIKHHYFGSFLYNQIIAIGLDEAFAIPISEAAARFVMLKNFDKNVSYVSWKGLFFVLSAFTDKFMSYTELDCVLGDNIALRFVARTSVTSVMLLYAAYLGGDKKEDVLVESVMLQLLSSVTPVDHNLSMNASITSFASTVIDYASSASLAYTAVASI